MKFTLDRKILAGFLVTVIILIVAGVGALRNNS
jgi:hypothetical protein